MLSLEGRKFWILGLLPLRRERLLWGKFAFSATFSLITSETLIVLSDLILHVPLFMVAVHALTLAIIALGLSGISVGLGATMPNFRETDPSKIAVGFGGTLNLVASLLFLIVEVLLMAMPFHLGLILDQPASQTMLQRLAIGGLVLGVTIGIAAVMIPMRVGARTLKRMEF
jgi:ABC-2 type transport system permease protein